MKHKHLPQLYGVVKDYHPRMIPENKVSDCDNVIFRQGRVRRRYGYATLGPDHLNGAINGIAYYEQVRLGSRYTLVFTSRNAYLYDTTTGTFTPISQSYNTGTARVNCLAVTGVGSTWLPASWTLNDVYQIKFGTNSPSGTSVNFTGTTADVWTERTGAGSRTFHNLVSSYDGTKLAMCVYAPGYIYTSTDSGATWTERTGAGSRNWIGLASSSDGTKLAACNGSGGYIYTSTDSGATWTERTGSGGRNWYDIASSSDGTKLVACVVGGYIYTSTDSGATWTARTSAGSRSWKCVDSSADGTKLVACVYSGYIYTSTDSGATWTERTGAGASGWYECAISDSGSLIFVCPYSGYMYKSANGGSSWTQITSAGSRLWVSIACVPDGTKLVACVKGGYIYNSADSGVTWASRSSAGIKNWEHIDVSSDGLKVAVCVNTGYMYTSNIANNLITSPSSLANLFVGLELTATFLQAGTRIKSIDWSGNTITIDRDSIADVSGGSISADVSTWYTIHSVDSATGITLHAISTFTGNTTNSSAVVSGIADTSVLHVGMGLSGSGIPSNAYILTIDSSTQITMSAAATATATGVTISTGVVITSGHEVNYVISLCFNGADDDYWSFAYPYLSSVGDKILVASNGIDPILKWAGIGSISNLGGSPPVTAKYIGYFGASMYEHFIAAWTTDSGNNLPQTIEVSDAGNPESWSGTYYDLLQKNDEIIGMEILKNRLVIYKNKSISLCYPTPEGGNSDPFDLDQDVIIDIEIPVGRTVVNFGDYHLFLGMDNVYRFNGIGLEPIGTEVINTMKNEWNGAFMHHAFAFTIPSENLYCIFIPTLELRDENNNVIKQESEYPDKAYVYNYVEGTWSIWTFPVNPTTLISQQFTCAGFVTKLYAPTVADIDALNQTYADMNMRWSDLIAYSNIQSLLLGDNNGYIYEMRDVYDDDNGTVIAAAFTTRDYALNDPKHTFMLLEAVVGMARRLTGTIQIRASVDFGETWSAWVPVVQAGGAEYVEYIANFIQKGLQVRFEVGNVAGADFEVESIMIGYNDEMGKKK